MAYIEHVIGTKNELLTSGLSGSPGNPTPNRKDHWGCDFIDIAGQCNTPRGVDVIALADGVCVERICGQLVGWTVTLKHDGSITRYQHMRNGSVLVEVGQKVAKGQKIGVMGNTGYCLSSNTSIPPEFRGTHLHLGVKENSTAYNNGYWVDPVPYLTGKKTIAPISGMVATPTSTQPTQPAQPTPTHDFKAGDTVKVKQATKQYVGGLFIPAWVKNNAYKVMQVGREKLLLADIMSWVYEADVDLIKRA